MPIVREGVLRGFLSSRETAAEIGLERSGGCTRADGFARQPLVRMTNVNLEPGDAGSLEDLIADTERGILIETNRSWSIDDRRLHFQFEGEAAWEIRGGERGRLLRNPSYAGVTPELLGRLRRGLLGPRVAARLGARLRQGRAGADGARLPRRGAGPLPRRGGGRCLSCARAAERALRQRAAARRAGVRDARALAAAALRR